MKRLLSKKFYKINRSLHRDLGYLFIGLTFIYAISGVALLLRHYDINVSYNKTKTELTVDKNLNKSQLKEYWNKNKIKKELPKLVKISSDSYSNKQINGVKLFVKKGEGVYYPNTGKIEVYVYKTNKFFKFVNNIHYNTGGKFTWLGIIYAVSLIFFAVSGAIMLRGKNSFMRRGVWFTVAGIVIPVIIYFLF